MRAAILLLSVSASFAAPQLVTPRRHYRAIVDVQPSRDGKWAASLGADETIRIWSLPDLVHLRTFSTPGAGSLAVGPQARIAWGAGYSVSILNVADGKTLAHFDHLPDQANSLAWSPDGTYLLTAFQKLVRIDPATGASTVLAPNTFAVQRIVFLNGGARVLISGSNWIRIFRSADWVQESAVEFKAGTLRGVHVAVAPDQSWLAAISDDLVLHLYSLPALKETGSAKVAVGVPQATLADLGISSDSSTIAVNSIFTFERFDAHTLQRLNTSSEDGPLLSHILRPAFSASMTIGGSLNGDLVGLGPKLETTVIRRADPGSRVRFLLPTQDGVLLGASATAQFRMDGGIWNVGKEIREITPVLGSPLAYFPQWQGKPGPWTLIARSQSRELVVRNVKTEVEVHAGDFGWADAASSDGTVAVGAGADGKSFTVVNVVARQTKKLADLELMPRFAISPGGETIALATDEGKLQVWSGPSWSEAAALDTPPKPQFWIGPATASALVFSGNGQLLAAGLVDGTVRVWNPAASRQTARFSLDQNDLANAIAFSPDGLRLVVATRNGAVLQLDLASGRELWRWSGLETPASFVSYISQNRIVAACPDGLLSVLDPATKQRLGTFFLQTPRAGPWVAVSQTGFFEASEASYDELLWRFSQDTFDTTSVSRYFGDFFLPGVFGRIWAGAAPRPPAAIERLNRITAQVAVHEVGSHDPAAREIKVELSVSGPHARDLSLFRNNTLIRQWTGAAPPTVRATVKLQAGENQFTAYAFNYQHVRTESARLTVRGGADLERPGTLYVLAVGIDDYSNPALRLDYAKKDATALASVLKSGRAGVVEMVDAMENILRTKKIDDPRLPVWRPSSGAVVVSTLEDGSASKAAILQAIRAIAKKALPEDSFVFYFAGHGLAAEPRYYLVPSGAGLKDLPGDLTALKPRMISDLDLESALEEMDVASGALIIDACESGQAVSAASDLRRGPIDATGLAQLAFEKDLWLLAASQSTGSAFELKQKGHGLLAYALTDDSLGKGRLYEGGFGEGITLAEWLEYAADRVPELQIGAISARRGLRYQPQTETPRAETPQAETKEVQRPRLLSRARPGAQPLVLAPAKEPDPFASPVP